MRRPWKCRLAAAGCTANWNLVTKPMNGGERSLTCVRELGIIRVYRRQRQTVSVARFMSPRANNHTVACDDLHVVTTAVDLPVIKVQPYGCTK